jgi:GxxExxY protein
MNTDAHGSDEFRGGTPLERRAINMDQEADPSGEGLNRLTEAVIGCAFTVLNTLGSGFLEKVYENALAHEIGKSGLRVQQQRPIPVDYDGIRVGDFVADLVVEDVLIVEIKATHDHHDIFVAQCLNYLKATGLPICLLLNFGKSRLDIKRLRC